MDNIIICCATGKSGGHIIPNLTWARKQYPHAKILFFSNNTPLDYALLKNNVDYHVPLVIPRTGNLVNKLILPCALGWASLQSVFYLIRYQPHVILTTGGIEALPVCFAGWLLRIPIDLYEVNAAPGKASYVLSFVASKIFVCFKKAQQYFKNAQLIDYPMRDISSEPITIPHFSKERKTILILGGSQGSKSLNSTIKTIISKNTVNDRIQIIHQYGSDAQEWNNFYTQAKVPAVTFDFSSTIHAYYPHADIVICRSGAGSLFETIYFKKKCITIPLEHVGGNHQVVNAHAMAQEYPDMVYVFRGSDEELLQLLQGLL